MNKRWLSLTTMALVCALAMGLSDRSRAADSSTTAPTTSTSDGKLNVTKVRFGKKTGGKSGGGRTGGKKSKDAATQPSAQ